MPNKKINQLDSRVIAATDLMLVGDPSTGVSFKSLVSGLGAIYVPNSRTLIINGTEYDLSANRTWNVGTVTSVNMSVPTGLTISGNPITGSGTLALALASGYTIPTQALLDGKVPYTGATGNVDLGEHQLKAGQYEFDQSPTGAAGVGIMRWNSTDGTLDLGLKGGNVTLQIGQEQVQMVVNKSGGPLNESAYQVVKVTSAQGQRLAVDLAQGNNDANSTDTLGIVTETIANNQEGFITTSGLVREINTTGSLQGETWVDGDVLYLSPTTAGAITNVKPTAPQHTVILGYVVYAHANHGKIFVKCDNGYELGELHNVDTTGAVNGNVLKYNGTIWVPSTDTDTGITSLNGLTALSQTFATGTTGTDFNIGSAGSTHTFNIPSASATNRGALTSADWTIFNGKENVLTFNSPLSRSTNTISIPVATSSVNGYLSSTDWNIFNNKQNALTNPITGTGNVNQVAFFNSLASITSESNLYWDATNNKLGIQNTNPIALNVNGSDLVIGDGSPTNKGLTIFGGTDGSIFFADNASTYAGYIQYGHSIDTFTFGTNNIPRMTLSGAGLSIGASNAIVDTDKFLVLDAGVVKYRTGAEVLSDIGGQASGNYITALTGEVTASGPGSAAATLLNSAVIGKVLTGLNLTGGGTISATDTILQAFGKTQNQISALVGGVMYEGVWNASTNTPAIVSGVGSKGDYYVVSVAGSTNIDGISDWKVGDWIIFNGTNWDKVDNTDAVSSVNGFTGAVNLTTANISEVTNLYFTDARVMSAMLTGYTIGSNTAITFNDSVLTAFGKAQAQINTKQNIITLTTTGSSGSATFVSDTLNVPTYTLAGLGGQPQLNGTGFVKATGTTISYDNSTYALDSAVVHNTGTETVAGAKTFTSAVTSTNFVLSGGTGNTGLYYGHTNKVVLANYTVGGGIDFETNGGAINMVLDASGNLDVVGNVTGASIIKSGGTSSQYLMADGSVSTLTNPVTGTGTTNYLPKWTSGSAIGNSQLFDNGTNVGIGNDSPTFKLDIARAGGLGIRVWNTSNTDDAYLQATTTLGSGLFGINAVGQYLYNGTAIPILFYTNAAERMRLTSTGNLLLNSTTDNGNRLQVTGDGYFSGSLGVGTASPAALLHVNSTGTHTFIYSTISGSSAIALDNQGGDLRIFTGGGERMRIASTGAATFSSSVTATSLTLGDSNNLTWGGSYGANIPTIVGVSGASGYLAIYPAGSTLGEKFRFTNGGNLLVGTTTDSGERLVVSGSGIIKTASAGSLTARIRNEITSTSGSTGYGLAIESEASAATSYALTVRNLAESQTYLHILTQSGKVGWVGFGTNNPTSPFHVSSGAATFSSSVTSTDYNLSALNTAPATSSSTGTVGQIRIDANHIYVCTATNTWKRVAISTF